MRGKNNLRLTGGHGDSPASESCPAIKLKFKFRFIPTTVVAFTRKRSGKFYPLRINAIFTSDSRLQVASAILSTFARDTHIFKYDQGGRAFKAKLQKVGKQRGLTKYTVEFIVKFA